MRTTSCSLLILLVLFTGAASARAQGAPIPNFLRVNENFCTGGQPSVEELTRLRNEGTRAVLNLRLPSEHDAAAEEATVRQLGLKYFNIPVASNAPQDAQVVEFLRITDDSTNQPMFIHCGSANRAGGFWMIRRVLRDGWSIADAEAEARRIGMTSATMRDFAVGYIERNR